jgi:hypothetical protein
VGLFYLLDILLKAVMEGTVTRRTGMSRHGPNYNHEHDAYAEKVARSYTEPTDTRRSLFADHIGKDHAYTDRDEADYAAKVNRTYEDAKLGPQEFINRKWSENAQVAQNGPNIMDDIFASINQANENIAMIHYALEALHDRVFGARSDAKDAKEVSPGVPDNALGRIHAALSNQHSILARLDAVKNRLVELA